MSIVEEFSTGLESPGKTMKAVTPNDGTDLPDGLCRSLYIGSGASKNVVVVTRDGDELTIPVADNFYLLLQVKRVKSTNTTASSIFAIY